MQEKFEYDAIEQERIDNKLRERILCLDASQMSAKEIRELFRNMNHTIFSLNVDILGILDELKTREKAINISLL